MELNRGVGSVCLSSYYGLVLQVKASLYITIAGFQCHAIQTDQNKNQNCAIDKVQNLGNERR